MIWDIQIISSYTVGSPHLQYAQRLLSAGVILGSFFTDQSRAAIPRPFLPQAGV
jgi:hypothetical protein